METTSKHEGPCVYVLELIGDPVNSGGSVTIDIGGTSLDRATLENLKVEKDAELSEYFDGACVDPDCSAWEGDCECECDKNHVQDADWCYRNSDYSRCPTWVITSYPLL